MTAKRLSLTERTASAQSLSRASPSAAQHSTSHKASGYKPHKTHIAGHGRLPHTRNLSHGKNLNRLAKQTTSHGGGEDGATVIQRKAKAQTPPASPSNNNVKRNSSTASLSRAGSKVSLKQNISNVSLKRDQSGTKLNRTGRPTTPLRKSHSNNKDLTKLSSKANAKFSVGSDGQDDEWTEDSNSQSPSTTRHNSIHGILPQKELPPDHASTNNHGIQSPPDSPPDSPTSSTSTTSPPEPLRVQPQRPQHPSHPLDADAITSRLLSRRSHQNLQPRLSSISATGTPGTQTPPHPSQPSMPANGISRFLNGPSSGSSTTHTHNPDPLSTDYPSASPPTTNPPHATDNVRRAKSAANLSTNPGPSGRASPPSYTIDPQQHRRAGGATQAKLDLWRTQSHVEPSQGPPAPLLKSAGQGGMGWLVGGEERRIRLWERAQAEMVGVCRFRSPVVEAVGRVRKKERRERDKERERERGRRGVRFETGEEGVEEVEEVLRRMWEGVGDGAG